MSVDDVWDRAERRQEKHEADIHARIAELRADVVLARTALARYGEDDPDCIREADQHLRHALGLSTSPNPLTDVKAVSIEKVSCGPDREFEYRPRED